EARRHLRATRPPHQLDVVEVGRAVGPLIGAWQRAFGLGLVEPPRVSSALLQRRGQGPQARRGARPVVQRRLQGGRDGARLRAAASAAGAGPPRPPPRPPSRPLSREASFTAPWLASPPAAARPPPSGEWTRTGRRPRCPPCPAGPSTTRSGTRTSSLRSRT